jgi:hypothetical protein
LDYLYVYVNTNGSTLQYTYSPSSGWNSPLLANHSQTAISWGSKSVRIYEVANGTVVEHGNDGTGWYLGALPQPSGDAVAAAYVGIGVRVYVSNNGTLTEYCNDFSNPGWYVGGFGGTGAKGTLISVSASVSGSTLDYLYVYVNTNGSTLQYTYSPSSGWNSPLTLSF